LRMYRCPSRCSVNLRRPGLVELDRDRCRSARVADRCQFCIHNVPIGQRDRH
jgi:hypothetical protein